MEIKDKLGILRWEFPLPVPAAPDPLPHPAQRRHFASPPNNAASHWLSPPSQSQPALRRRG